MKTATISIEDGNTTPKNGIVNIWWWRDGADPNQQMKSKKPIYDILNAKQVFQLVSGDTIEVDEKIIIKHFDIVI